MTVIRPSPLQRDGLFGALTLLFALALWRGFTGATTTAGQIAVVVFCGGVLALLAWAWTYALLHPRQIEISAEAVTLTGPGGERETLSRSSGDELRVVVVGSGRYRRSALTIPGSGTNLPLGFFSLGEVQRGCTEYGWRFTRPGRRGRPATR